LLWLAMGFSECGPGGLWLACSTSRFWRLPFWRLPFWRLPLERRWHRRWQYEPLTC
jgi:hypothetical protein